jgi:hypothetical protein
VNIVRIEDFQLARLNKRAAVFGMKIVPHGDTWALFSHDVDGVPFETPEIVGTLAEISADLDFIDEQAKEPNDDIPILG